MKILNTFWLSCSARKFSYRPTKMKRTYFCFKSHFQSRNGYLFLFAKTLFGFGASSRDSTPHLESIQHSDMVGITIPRKGFLSESQSTFWKGLKISLFKIHSLISKRPHQSWIRINRQRYDNRFRRMKKKKKNTRHTSNEYLREGRTIGGNSW